MNKIFLFDSPEEMHDTLLNTDLYSPDLEEYVFRYSETGAICVYDIGPSYAASLIKKSKETEQPGYLAQFLGAGGMILEVKDAIRYCKNHYKEEWFCTRDE